MFSFITDNRIHAFMAYANLAMIPKRLETELTNITKKGTSVHCPFFVLNILFLLYLLSLIGIFFSRYLFVFTYFDSSRRHTHATTHATGTQIVRAKMMSPDAIFSAGERSRALAFSLAFAAENIKNPPLVLRVREKI